ncbi:MAG: hypothetical protein QOD26_1155 [Betaproteobacteria bacterium]|jgi:hypothetical protein|nr:hypothetical protein [Betaproteobacteria bacterium]
MAKPVFDIALVGAGAISAGAYTGGVLDFMVQALDCWHAQERPHDVRISVFSGASAGAITAALGTAFLASDQPPVRNPEEGRANAGRNKLFDSWVERIDIATLLQKRDLPGKAPVASLLDSTVLKEIADTGLDVQPRATRRPYLADDFHLVLTVTNLRGVPYAFTVVGQHEETYDMSLHADYVHFRVNDAASDDPPDRYTMKWSGFGGASELKEKLKLAALASGAFPVGLVPRVLSHDIPAKPRPDWYSARTWPMLTPHSDPHHCVTETAVPARWGFDKEYRFDFQCVDGGVMNNEPLEIARRLLAPPDGRARREGNVADRAVLLIDPFPANTTFDAKYAPAPDIVKTLLALFGALKNQARFKPEELLLAADPNVFSRFMIAPSREGANGAAYPIACGALEGFGGFLKRDFREHDFFLGRRNAQRFLTDHFVLPEENLLFAAWTAQQKQEHVRVVDGKRYLPIIPLVGAAKEVCEPLPWPSYSGEDLERLQEQIAGRVDTVVDRLVAQYFESNNIFIRWGAGWFLGKKKDDIVKAARGKIALELSKMGLMPA